MGDEFQLQLQAHPFCQTLERPQRGIGGSIFQPADIGLIDPRDLCQLLLCQIAVLPSFQNGVHDLPFRLLRFPLCTEFRVFHLLVQCLSEILSHCSALLSLLMICSVPLGFFDLSRGCLLSLFHKSVGQDDLFRRS